MNFLGAFTVAVVLAIGIFITGVMINARTQSLNMRTYRIGNIVIPIIFFVLALFLG